MATGEHDAVTREQAAMIIERETAKRSLDVAQATIVKLEKRVKVLEAQVEECKMELEMTRPKLPLAQALTLDVRTTALLVLGLSTRCTDPRVPCHRLVPSHIRIYKESPCLRRFCGLHRHQHPEGQTRRPGTSDF